MHTDHVRFRTWLEDEDVLREFLGCMLGVFFFKLTCFVCCRNFLRDTFFFFSSSAFCNYDNAGWTWKMNQLVSFCPQVTRKQDQGLLRIYKTTPRSFPFAFFCLPFLFTLLFKQTTLRSWYNLCSKCSIYIRPWLCSKLWIETWSPW